MVASGVVTFTHSPGVINPADVLSKHWAKADVWATLQPILFWKGNTAELLAHKDKEGSNKKSLPSEPAQLEKL